MQTAVVPEDLVALPPGPGLGATLGAVELAVVPNDRMLEVLRAQYRQLCHEQARMAAVIAEVGRCAGHPQPGAVTRLDAPERYAPEETRAALRWTRAAAEGEHDFAETIVYEMPELFAAWLAGEVDRQRVRVFDRYLCGLTPTQVTRICAAAVPRAPKLTTGQLAVLLRRMVLAVDPAAAERWYRKGIRERNVVAVIDHDGTVTLSANGLPADEAEAACVRLQDLAAAAKRAGHPGLIGQIRCDLFLGMLDGRFQHLTRDQVMAALITGYRPTGPAGTEHPNEPDPAATDLVPAAAEPGSEDHAGPDIGSGHGGPTPGGTCPGGTCPGGTCPGPTGSAGPDPGTGTAAATPDSAAPRVRDERVRDERVRDDRMGIEIRVGLATLLGRDEYPGEIPGLGLLPAPDTRHRVALQRRAQWRFAVTDTAGQLLSEGATRRRPPTVGPHPVRSDGPPGGIVEIHLPVALLDELLADPATSDGWAAVLADIAAQHRRRDQHLADLDSHHDARLPGSALRRHTEIRDRVCTFPGCRHRAHTAEQDHTDEHHNGGPTVGANLGPLCDHDHDVKHRGGWTLTQPEPGTFV